MHTKLVYYYILLPSLVLISLWSCYLIFIAPSLIKSKIIQHPLKRQHSHHRRNHLRKKSFPNPTLAEIIKNEAQLNHINLLKFKQTINSNTEIIYQSTFITTKKIIATLLTTPNLKCEKIKIFPSKKYKLLNTQINCDPTNEI